jgi:hypothetical protein
MRRTLMSVGLLIPAVVTADYLGTNEVDVRGVLRSRFKVA